MGHETGGGSADDLVVALECAAELVDDTLEQQLAIARSELVHDLVELGPELVSVNTGARNRFVIYKIVQILGDLDAANLNAFCHRCLPQWVCSSRLP